MSTINSSSAPFDPFANPFGVVESTYTADFSPTYFFSPLEDLDADLTSDSADSLSPVSPGLPASPYGFASTEEWTHCDPIEHSPEPDVPFSLEPFEGSLLSSITSEGIVTPAINPMALTIPAANASPIVPHGPSNKWPVFQQPQVVIPRSPQLPNPSMVILAGNGFLHQESSPKRDPPRILKRKSSASASDDNEPSSRRTSPLPLPAVVPRAESKDKATPNSRFLPTKTAHNMIEKRYRTNLNDKIAQLRDAVPALRHMVQRSEQPGSDSSTDSSKVSEDAGGLFEDEFSVLPPVVKLNKATILSRATEYIAQLERRNRNLATENRALRGRMEGLEMLLDGQPGAASAAVWS